LKKKEYDKQNNEKIVVKNKSKSKNTHIPQWAVKQFNKNLKLTSTQIDYIQHNCDAININSKEMYEIIIFNIETLLGICNEYKMKKTNHLVVLYKKMRDNIENAKNPN
ncbi:1562_t:CDS:1, partial [Cetraspora pellucida]